MKTIFTYLAFLLIAMQTNAQCWSKIASGSQHTLAIKSDGTLWAWGYNYYGQLGDGTTVDKFIPTQIGTDNNWQSISVGISHSMAIKNNNTLWAWGKNDSGQLGDGTSTNKLEPIQIDTDTDWRSIDAGNNFSVAIKGLGTSTTLWTWGENTYGQLGLGDTTNRLIPTQVGTSSSWKSASAGGNHIVALQNIFGGTGTLWAWGFNSSGQLGNNTNTNELSPIQIGTDVNWTTAVAGKSYNLARKTTGTLWSWGMNFYGQLGLGATPNIKVPTQIGADTNWSSIISAGINHSLVKKSNGTLWAWGSNSNGQLGFGNTSSTSVPVQVGTDTNWANVIVTGELFSAVLKFDGTLYTWGFGNNGELGNGTINTSSLFPVSIACPPTLGIVKNIIENNDLIIYPNPSTNGEFAIQSKANIQSITAFDILGKKINIEKNNNLYKINTSAGMYMLKILDFEGNIQNKKLIIK